MAFSVHNGDTFVESTNQRLEDHTPTGSNAHASGTWTEVWRSGVQYALVDQISDNVRASAASNNNGFGYALGPDPTDPDVKLAFRLVQEDNTSASHNMTFYWRYQDADNHYSLWIYRDNEANNYQVWKKVSGSWTQKAQVTQSNTGGDTIEWEMQGDDIVIRYNASDIITTSDTDITSAGKIIYSLGNEPDGGGNDIGGSWRVDDFVLSVQPSAALQVNVSDTITVTEHAAVSLLTDTELDPAGSQAETHFGTSHTFSFTTSGSNIGMFVGTLVKVTAASQSVSSVTYDGAALTTIGSQLDDPISPKVLSDLRYISLSSGKTANVQVSLGGTATGKNMSIVAFYFTGSELTGPVGDTVAVPGSSNTASGTVSSGLTEIVIDNMAMDFTDTVNHSSPQTVIVNQTTGGTGTNHGTHGISYKPGAASSTMTWTNADTSRPWSTIVASLVPSGSQANLSVNVNDSVTVTDAITVALSSVALPGAFDLIAVTEAVTIELLGLSPLSVSVNESITVTESFAGGPDPSVPVAVNVFDSITVTELVPITVPTGQITRLGPFGVPISILLGQALILPTLDAVANDTITVTEAVTVKLGFNAVEVFDSVTVVEDVTILLTLPNTLQVNTSDTILVTESVTAQPHALVPDVSDTILVFDIATVALPFVSPVSAEVFDEITTTESLTIGQLGLSVDVSDSVTVTDAVTIGDLGLSVSVFDEITVTDVVTSAVVLIVFKKTLSPLGTKVSQRQTHRGSE